MHIMFVGGGTAGHINPAIAVAGYIRDNYPDCKISYIGTKKGMENRLVPLAGYDFYSVDVAGFQRKLTVKNIFRNIDAVRKVFTSSIEARKLLKALKPDIVFGTGGYVCGPVLREAAKMGIKTAVHEANAYPGVTIKMLAPTVDLVMVAMEDALKNLNPKNEPVITGNPIRSSLKSVSKADARKVLNIPQNADVLLSFGGSLGARVINDAMLEVIKQDVDSKEFYIYHATGKNAHKEYMEKLASVGFDPDNGVVNVYEYIDNMDILMAAADLVICRAGAMTVNELQVCGKPAILIPSPYVAENHQFHNAMSLKKNNAAELIEEKDLNGEELYKTVKRLFSDKDKLRSMSEQALKIAIPDADRRIADELLKIIK
ncbi:MAG: undecaprenyldiphospho-muramoylpentapeptide beta-N-acetylglucosaminyltransferase [Ruminococcaceae bacterium]|nr:undecaprenyldiphospho-muramoylpentapeptide beta-N-acetylglucosaminyltransferase [Oscillospiraceae bacterium]